jgi:hypothetical protein
MCYDKECEKCYENHKEHCINNHNECDYSLNSIILLFKLIIMDKNSIKNEYPILLVAAQ